MHKSIESLTLCSLCPIYVIFCWRCLSRNYVDIDTFNVGNHTIGVTRLATSERRTNIGIAVTITFIPAITSCNTYHINSCHAGVSVENRSRYEVRIYIVLDICIYQVYIKGEHIVITPCLEWTWFSGSFWSCPMSYSDDLHVLPWTYLLFAWCYFCEDTTFVKTVRLSISFIIILSSIIPSWRI